jgi:hypothetical protein
MLGHEGTRVRAGTHQNDMAKSPVSCRSDQPVACREDDVNQEYDQNFNIVFSGKKRQETHDGEQGYYTDY